eukprot:TRINITY_DN39508_c0_g1_i1.p1 TRINITY_DN39508_c0_g1~~TRINITY_DN39508_c0_g1_i1.p1  ORF type:complete len:284 (-),score=40.91 TRINITY_DN39508_c0_g1_i1:140-991(-)
MDTDHAAIQPFKAMTWNVLAHVHTHWDKALHGGNANESAAQRDFRHNRIVQAILRELPDVALLQEVDEYFIPGNWQGGELPCGAHLPGYTFHHAYGPTGDGSGPLEGAGVLLREGVFEEDPEQPATKLNKVPERGWKSAIVLPVRRCHDYRQQVTFVSVHLPWPDNQPKIKILRDTLVRADPSHPIVLGGDFNTGEADLWNTLEPTLREFGVSQIPLSEGWPTCSGAEPCKRIDFLYCGLGVHARERCKIGNVPGSEQGPWSEGWQDGSDHAWVTAVIESPHS